MKPTHVSLRPHVKDRDHLYRLLQLCQGDAFLGLTRRTLLMVGLLAVGLLVPGAVGSTALCMAAVAGVACVTAGVDVVARDWFMHYLTLQDLPQRQENLWDVIGRWAESQKGGTDGEA